MAHYGKLLIQKLCDPDREKEFPGSETVRLLTGKKSCCVPSSWVSTPAGWPCPTKRSPPPFGWSRESPFAVSFPSATAPRRASPHRQRPLRRHERAGVHRPRPVPLRRGYRPSGPTAADQQKFTFSRQGNRATAKAGPGFYSKIDPGIVKYHFEPAAGPHTFTRT